jgi:thiamine biosynthesis lipoprotein
MSLCLFGSTSLFSQRHEFNQIVMGTRAEVICYAPNRQTADAAWADTQQRWQELNQILSDYESDSEVMKLAARQDQAPASWSPCSSDLFRILMIAQDISCRSGGAFDVTVGPLTRLWRQARRRGSPPSDERLAEARALVGYRALELDPGTYRICFLRPGMRLDFGAIGKGYAADAAVEVLRRHGIHQALVNMGGDLTLSDAPPDSAGWRIAVAPLGSVTVSGDLQSPSLLAANCGIATSGDSEQGLDHNGQRLSHLLDPRTGQALADSWSVTVIAESGTIADALASTLSILGPAQGLPWLEHHFPGVAVQFRRRGTTERIANEQFESYERTAAREP